MIGYILLGAAVLIIAALMYGHTEREHFTDIKGSFPKWTSVLDQVRRILDKSFEYDQAAFAKFATQQKELYDQAVTSTLKNLGSVQMLATIGVGAPTVQDITKFQESKDLVKYLPKGFKLNVDTPFDTRMAMLYSTRMYYANLVKTSKKDSDLMVGYGLLYPIDAVANLLKATMITVIFGLCAANKIIKKVKYDESKDPPPQTQKVEVVMK
jgi:hypothetical protein